MKTRIIEEGNAFYEVDEECIRKKQMEVEQTIKKWKISGEDVSDKQKTKQKTREKSEKKG